ncbi:CcmD family protein [bacterium]|nr:CcmD family protein [bacterium]
MNKLDLVEQAKIEIVYKSDLSGDMMVLASYIAFWVLIFGYMIFIHTKIKRLERKTDSIN